MSRLTQQSGGDSRYILVAKLDNARNLLNILKAVHFKESATWFVSNNGLKVTVEDAKCVQASAFVQSGIFQEYTFKEESATFRINLNVLLECLNIFGSSKDTGTCTALKMCYAGYGSPLILMLEEGGVLTDCSIQTQEPDVTLDFDFSSADVLNKIIMKSECLKEAFSELDMTSEVLQILMSPDNPYLRLSTFGHAGSTHSDFPKDSDMVESFECQQTQTNRYRISLLKPSTKALQLSSKISIRMDGRGFLSLQYMIINEDGQICFVEYLLLQSPLRPMQTIPVPVDDGKIVLHQIINPGTAKAEISSLRDEVKKLRKDLTQLFDKNETKDPWIKLNTVPVCFGAKNNKFGEFSVPSGGSLLVIKLVHVHGYVRCDKNKVDYWSYWGCGAHSGLSGHVNVVITTSTNSVLLPLSQFSSGGNKWSKIPGYNSLSPELVLSVFSSPLTVTSGQVLRLWYGEDLVNSTESDNDGTSCCDVFARFL